MEVFFLKKKVEISLAKQSLQGSKPITEVSPITISPAAQPPKPRTNAQRPTNGKTADVKDYQSRSWSYVCRFVLMLIHVQEGITITIPGFIVTSISGHSLCPPSFYRQRNCQGGKSLLWVIKAAATQAHLPFQRHRVHLQSHAFQIPQITLSKKKKKPPQIIQMVLAYYITYIILYKYSKLIGLPHIHILMIYKMNILFILF